MKGHTDMGTTKEMLTKTLGSNPKTLEEARQARAELLTTQTLIQGWLDEAQAIHDVDALMRLRTDADALPVRITAATAVVKKFEVEALEVQAKALDAAMVAAADLVKEYAPTFEAAKAEYDRRMADMRDAQGDRRPVNLALTQARTDLMNLIGAVRDGKPLVLASAWMESPEMQEAERLGKINAAKKVAYRNPVHEEIKARMAEAEARGADARARGEVLPLGMAPNDVIIRPYPQPQPDPAPAPVGASVDGALVLGVDMGTISDVAKAAKAARGGAK